MYKSPAMGDESRVLVDQKVDIFLKQHFLQYEKYCSRTVPADVPGGLYYLGVAEDEQYDDLTILGIKRKIEVTASETMTTYETMTADEIFAIAGTPRKTVKGAEGGRL
jgi:hypothetical protein